METTWLSMDELARYLKVPKSTLYKFLVSRDLPGYKVGRSWRFDRDEVNRWVKSRHAMSKASSRRRR